MGGGNVCQRSNETDHSSLTVAARQGAKAAQKRERNAKNAGAAAKSQLKAVCLPLALCLIRPARETRLVIAKIRCDATECQGHEHPVRYLQGDLSIDDTRECVRLLLLFLSCSFSPALSLLLSPG